MAGSLNRVDIQAISFSPIANAIMMGIQVDRAEPPFELLYGDVDVPTGDVLALDPNDGAAQWQQIGAALVRGIEALPAMPPSAGQWDGSAITAAGLGVGWRWSLNPAGLYTPYNALSLFFNDLTPSFPGIVPVALLDITFQLFSIAEGTVPVPFAAQLADYIGGHDGTINLLTEQFKPIE